MNLRLLVVSGLVALMSVPMGIGSAAFACDPENNNPCDVMPNDDFQYLYCKLSPTC